MVLAGVNPLFAIIIAMFLGYIKAMFKQLYPKSSTNFQRVYDINDCMGYIAQSNQHKGRIAPVLVIGNAEKNVAF